MQIENGVLVYLVAQSMTAKQLYDSLDPSVQFNVVEVGNRKIELLVPPGLRFSEDVFNRLVTTRNAWSVTKTVRAANGDVYVFYGKDNERSKVNETSQALAKDLFR